MNQAIIKPQSILLIFALSVLFSACGTVEQFQKRKYRPGFFINAQNTKPVTPSITSSQTTVTEENHKEQIAVPEKIKPEDLEEALSYLKKSGEIFNPNSKHIQRTSR